MNYQMKSYSKSEIVESNKLIATFLGYTYTPFDLNNQSTQIYGWWKSGIDFKSVKIKNAYLGRSHNDLDFHKNWNSLMRAVDEIESLDLKKYHYEWSEKNCDCISEDIVHNNFMSLSVEIENTHCMIYENLSLDPINIISSTLNGDFESKIEATYYCVVEFIKYYNILIQK